jgi:hypothetical protein
MWKNVLFFLCKVHKGTSSMHREMERPSKQVAWGEAKFVVTITVKSMDIMYMSAERDNIIRKRKVKISHTS